MKPEFLNMPFEAKSVEMKEGSGNIGIIEGYAAAFNNVDLGDDRIIKGAFKKTIKETKGVWPVLADHSSWEQLGFNVNAKEDDFGLNIVEELNLDVAQAAERYALSKQALRLKTKFGLSIGYRAIKFDFVTEEEVMIRNLQEIKIYEHSHVTFPMNDSASVTNAKNWEFESVTTAIKKIIGLSESKGISIKEVLQEIDKVVSQYKEPDDLVHSMQRLTSLMK